MGMKPDMIDQHIIAFVGGALQITGQQSDKMTSSDMWVKYCEWTPIHGKIELNQVTFQKRISKVCQYLQPFEAGITKLFWKQKNSLVYYHGIAAL
jgi:hypothetical protein